MAYALHIERDDQPILLDEWIAALESTPGVREQTEDTVAVNPKTGAEIRIGRNEGDAEVLVATGGFFGIGRREEWRTVFRFSNGRVSFNATRDVDSPRSAVRKAAAELAASLNAAIVGDEGERYEW